MRWTSFVLLMVGCSGGKDEPRDPGEIGDGPGWFGEVEPVVRERCGGCHQAGGIGPMALDTYEAAKSWAPAMAQSVSERTMPPWLVTDDGTCQEFQHSRWMSDEEIALVEAWAAAGAPEGDPGLAVSDPLPSPPTLDRVDLTVSTPTFTPVAAGSSYAETDEYRCFLMDDPTESDLSLTGFEVVPGNAAIVHHVLLMPVDPLAEAWDGRSNAVNIAEMNGADGRDGWPCFGTAGGNVREKSIPVTWAPGMGAVEFPGVGVPVAERDWFVVQVHYNLADPDSAGASDRTEIRLRTEASSVRAAYFALPDPFLASLFYGQPETIPPGEPAYEFSFEMTGSDALSWSGAPQDTWDSGFDLVGVFPHMHQRGAKQRLELIRSGTGAEECLAEVARWDFDWQLQYFYREPIRIEPDDVLRVTCTWDTSAVSAPTLPGWGTDNEMCLVAMMLAP